VFKVLTDEKELTQRFPNHAVLPRHTGAFRLVGKTSDLEAGWTYSGGRPAEQYKNRK
jgi:hypothetical protein